MYVLEISPYAIVALCCGFAGRARLSAQDAIALGAQDVQREAYVK